MFRCWLLFTWLLLKKWERKGFSSYFQKSGREIWKYISQLFLTGQVFGSAIEQSPGILNVFAIETNT